MATLGWANMVPAAIRAAASTPNVVFILCFLLPSLNAFYGPIANLFKMLRFPLFGASWKRTTAVVFSRSRAGAQRSAPRSATPAAAGGSSDKDGVFRGRLQK